MSKNNVSYTGPYAAIYKTLETCEQEAGFTLDRVLVDYAANYLAERGIRLESNWWLSRIEKPAKMIFIQPSPPRIRSFTVEVRQPNRTLYGDDRPLVMVEGDYDD